MVRSAIQLIIDDQRCQACDDCFARRKCRGGAFRIIDPGEPPALDTTYCWGCFVCISACPHGAVVRPNAPKTRRSDL